MTLRIKHLRVRAVRVPMPDPHQTASGTVSESPLVLTDVVADEGTVGHSIVFTYTAAAVEPAASPSAPAVSLDPPPASASKPQWPASGPPSPWATGD